MFRRGNSAGSRRRGSEGDPLFGAVIRQLQRGIEVEENARLLFLRSNRLLHHFFRRQGVPAERREDLVQETMLRVFRKIDQYQGDARFTSWLLGIAANVARAQARSERALKRSAPLISLDEAPAVERGRRARSLVAPGPAPLERALEREQTRAVERALIELPEQMRRCAVLRYRQGFTYSEIAALLDISLNSVRVQLWRARRRLERSVPAKLDSSADARPFPPLMDPSAK